MTITELFATNLKRIRLSRGLSQDSLSELCDCSKNYISELERGQKFASASLIDKLSEVLDVLTHEFFIDLNSTKNKNIKETFLKEMLTLIDSDMRKILSEYPFL